MIKEAKNIDFYTTGNQPSEEVLAKISACIKIEKEHQKKKKNPLQKKTIKQEHPQIAK